MSNAFALSGRMCVLTQVSQGVATFALGWVQVGLSARFSVWP